MWRIPSIASILLLAACTAVGPDYAAPETAMPAAFTAELDRGLVAGPTDLAAWWQGLGDPALDRLVAKALAANLDLRAALARIDEARARRGAAKAELGPAVATSLQASRTDTASSAAGDSHRESYSAGVDASWEVDLFGGQRRALEAAGADLAATEADFHGAQVSLAAQVAGTYLDLRTAEARLELVRRSVDTREQTLELTGWREQAGLATSLDTAQARSSLEQTRASIPPLELAAATARHRLAILAGRTPGELDELLAAGSGIPQVPDRIAVGIPADTLTDRPDLRAAERDLAAATARVGQAEAQRYPSLRLSASIGVDALDPSGLLDRDSLVSSLLGGLTAPIFQSGRIRRSIEVQQALERQAESRYRSAILTALGEVEDALAGLRRNQERLDGLSRALDAAREATSLAENRYSAGLIDLLVLLDTQRTLLSLEEQEASARGDLAGSLIQLYRALGGGWTNETGVPPTSRSASSVNEPGASDHGRT
ncbi:MAG: efflux transporter outer membrane subunit [Acidobacteria bacterium]|nr:efflux transporter outer membrane subunit [Acidobacteriota bacterium]